MRRFVPAAVVAAALAGVFGLAAPAAGQVPLSKPDEPYPVELRVGDVFEVCKSGQIECPARIPICDDPNVATPVDVDGALGFKAVGPGTTLCSAISATAQRRVFRIVVR